MNRFLLSLSFVLLFAIPNTIIAQNTGSCASESLSPEEKSVFNALMKKTIAERAALRVSNASMTCVPIKVHDVLDGSGGGGLDMEKLNIGLADLNFHFKPAGLEFYYCDGISVVDNAAYYDFDSADESALYALDPLVNNAMNLYFVNSVTRSGNAAAGYASYPSNSITSTRCMMDKNVLGLYDNGTFAHEYGHHFSLYHTQEGTEDGPTDFFAENVARTGVNSNCTSKGDELCDTEADPKGTTSNCVYTGTGLDIHNEPYNPPIDNIMSYYSDQCGGRFTAGQIGRISAALAIRNGHSAYSLDCAPASVNVASNLTATLTSTTVTLNWTDNASNEMGYLIERSTTSSSTGFTSVVKGGVGPNGTSFEDNTIESNTTYWYRVKASNGNCNSYSNVAEIVVGLVYCQPNYYTPFLCDNATISNVNLDAITDIDNTSTCTGNAYSDYTGTIEAEVVAGATYPITIDKSANYSRYIQVFIDFNQDGDFEEVNEKMFFDNMSATFPTYSDDIIVPLTAYNGTTRMRVVMSNQAGPIEASCSTQMNYGETEDYAIAITGGEDKPVAGIWSVQKAVVKTLSVYPNPGHSSVGIAFDSEKSNEVSCQFKDLTGKVILEENFQGQVGNNKVTYSIESLPVGIYVVQVKNGEETLITRLIKQ